jgi:hypothetical protein
LVNVNRGDGFRRFEVVDVLYMQYALGRRLLHLYVPPVEVFNDSDGELACFVDEEVNVKALLHPFKVIERHTLQSIDLRTCR